MANLAVLVAGLAALAGVIGLGLVAGQVRMLERLRLNGEQSLAATRAEAVTTPAELRMLAVSSSDRMAALHSALQLALEQMRASLAREQGELRFGLAETQRR